MMDRTVKVHDKQAIDLGENRLGRNTEENIPSFLVHGTPVRREQEEALHAVRSYRFERTLFLFRDSLEERFLQRMPPAEHLRFGVGGQDRAVAVKFHVGGVCGCLDVYLGLELCHTGEVQRGKEDRCQFSLPIEHRIARRR